jgi:hypothetical protein
MDLNERISAFASVGEVLRSQLSAGPEAGFSINGLIDKQAQFNQWFTASNVRRAVTETAALLTVDNLRKWTNEYPALHENNEIFIVAVIMAGNIPLVGFHDFLSVLISGNRLLAKTSSKDPELLQYIYSLLCEADSRFEGTAEFTQSVISGFDKVIATGSDNTSRYFEYYFGKYPSIIRKNRNSIAVLSGNESDDDIENLGDDVFSYFGLGCRNVSKIYIPRGYDCRDLAVKWHKHSDIINHHKYANNYDYNKAVWLVNREEFTDCGFVLFREDKRLASPISVVNYEYFDNISAVKADIESLNERIQCVIGRDYIPFGKAQSPYLWDYADGTDTLDFILKKKS